MADARLAGRMDDYRGGPENYPRRLAAGGTGFPSGPSVLMTLDLTLLGGFEARVTETDALLRLPTRKCEAALAYICMHPRQAVRRDLLISLLWADVPRSQGRHSLRQTLTRLRRAFSLCVG